MIRPVRSRTWQVHGPVDAGIIGQLTHCRTGAGVDFYVRENAKLSSMEHFCISSGARQGRKSGDSNPGESVLELCAPAVYWEEIALEVHALDPLHRRVVANRLFTARWAEHQLARAELTSRQLAGLP